MILNFEISILSIFFVFDSYQSATFNSSIAGLRISINGIESKNMIRYQLCSVYGAPSGPSGQSYQLFGCPSLVYESYACNINYLRSTGCD